LTVDGFGDGALSFFEEVARRPSWDYVLSLRPVWEHNVHLPMEQLFDELGSEFGRDAHVYNLHRDPYLWSHQIGVISVSDTIGFRAVLSIDGLTAEGGWLRSSRDQVARYRQAVASEDQGNNLASMCATLVASGHEIRGKRLRGCPRGWSAEHPRLEFARHLSLLGSRSVGLECLDSVAASREAVATQIPR